MESERGFLSSLFFPSSMAIFPLLRLFLKPSLMPVAAVRPFFFFSGHDDRLSTNPHGSVLLMLKKGLWRGGGLAAAYVGDT